MSAFKYQWNQTIDVGTAGLLSKQWTSIRHILSLLVTANACVHVTAYVAVRRSLSTTYTAVVLGLLLRQYVSYQFGVWAELLVPALDTCMLLAPHVCAGGRGGGGGGGVCVCVRVCVCGGGDVVGVGVGGVVGVGVGVGGVGDWEYRF